MKYNNFEDIYNFCTIVDAGSLQSASVKMGIPAPTLSRRLKKLEQRLGLKLLHRNAHNLHLTAEGEVYYNQFSPHFGQLEKSFKLLNNQDAELEGNIILSVPEGLLNICVNAWIIEFLKLHPKINILLEKAFLAKDFEAKKIDIAIKLFSEGPSDWISRKMFAGQKWLVASADYMAERKALTSLSQLKDFDLLSNDDYLFWQFIENGKIVNFNFETRYKPHSVLHALEACINGIGIGYFPKFLVEPYVQSKKMVKLLPNHTTDEAGVYMLYTEKSLLSKRVRAFVEFLEKKSSNPQEIFNQYLS